MNRRDLFCLFAFFFASFHSWKKLLFAMLWHRSTSGGAIIDIFFPVFILFLSFTITIRSSLPYFDLFLLNFPYVFGHVINGFTKADMLLLLQSHTSSQLVNYIFSYYFSV